MSELLRWETSGGPIVVEVEEQEVGYASVVRRPGEIVHSVKGKFEDALESLRDSAESALSIFRDDVLRPDEVAIEFGVKLNAAAGAVLAKVSTEGHFVITLKWVRDPSANGGHTE